MVEAQVTYTIAWPGLFRSRSRRSAQGTTRRPAALIGRFDFRPGAIIERFNLKRPIYRQATDYGHFGKPGLSMGGFRQ